MGVLTTFIAEAEAVEAAIASIAEDDWGRPGLGEWTVAELVAHLVRAADRIDAYLDLEVEGDEPVCDRVTYFVFDMAAMAPEIADRSRQDAERYGVEALPATFAAAWRRTAERAGQFPADHLLHTIRGPMAIQEYAATRVLELTVHHMDLCRALGRPTAPTEAGLAMTVDILQALLADETPTGMSEEQFVLAATGREPHDDPRFPVIH